MAAEKPEKYLKEVIVLVILTFLFRPVRSMGLSISVILAIFLGPMRSMGLSISVILAILFRPVRFMDLVVKFFGIEDVWIVAIIAGNMLLLNPIKLHISTTERLFLWGLIFCQT